ncbi:phosphogluconate dehydratase [Vulcaniibacterium tengchongense]|uniref:Phosphogluconate dehydratase n=1 Tax=Vulcaniibacterium tengchongense TaxID=1273429 RepID=A0A3N4W5X6_9GAMM|nr:6-phosphogluconate dehydratase [Vulcaniibacterium tengchongense]
MSLHPRVAEVTERIRERSRPTRGDYLARIEAARRDTPHRFGLGCGNLAHGFAAAEEDKPVLKGERRPNLGIVTAYNDMLSAHHPYGPYPPRLKAYAREAGATAQVAGGVPAMCDGVTQGRTGMELSLFSRDVIAQATAIALCHDMFDAALCLGICDKIVPGLLIGALAFGHLPVVFVPGGPMPSGLPNKAKVAVRERYAEGKATREELLEAEAQSYHSPGTCTFYGTANSNQVMLEAMGLQLPGSSFVNPGTPLREAFDREAVHRAARITALGDDYRPIGRLVDERAIVNALVALLATGGSTNHTIHFVAVARAAGLVVTWEDFDDLSKAVPLLARVYPNGEADVNGFAAAGDTSFVIRELLSGGLLHDIETVIPGGMRAYGQAPYLDGDRVAYAPAPAATRDPSVLRPLADPFDAQGGLVLMRGNLGRALGKRSAVKPEHRRVEAPAVVVDDPRTLKLLYEQGALPRDFVAVVRFQGPQANGMPELHSLMPLLGLMLNAGRRVALVTDGRLSGASGKVPSAIQVVPEAIAGGPLARVRDGDPMRVDLEAGVLEALVEPDLLASRPAAMPRTEGGVDLGRGLFAHNRANVTPADQGALSISLAPFSTGLRQPHPLEEGGE